MAIIVEDEYFDDVQEPFTLKKYLSYEAENVRNLLGMSTSKAEPSQQTRVRQLITNLAKSSVVMKMMEQRWREFNPNSSITAKLAGIAIDPKARKKFDSELDKMWRKASFGGGRGNAAPLEVVIGGGLHAAIYCAVRVANGNPPPLVIEGSDKVGGVFNCSDKPSFFLNSRNRPGDLSIPGQRNGALNVIPSGPVQPAHLSGDEYQRNSDIAFVIRAALAMSGKVMAGRKVVPSIEYIEGSGRYALTLDDDSRIYASRVLIATGLGEERRFGASGDRILSFLEFMSKMDKDFPLQGIEKVAVIGSGDSGRTAVEALTGQGPSLGGSVAALDYPTNIDWYGVDPSAVNSAGWETCNRSRYKGLARFLPRSIGGDSRVRPISDKASRVDPGYRCAYVNEKPYDLVIDCTGFDRRQELAGEFQEMQVGTRSVAKRVPNEEIYEIGVVAELAVAAQEKTNVPALKQKENSTSLFRYAGRTATLADTLDRPMPVSQDTKKGKKRGDKVGVDENGAALYIGDKVIVKGNIDKPYVESSSYFTSEVLRKRNDNNILVRYMTGGRTWIVAPNLVEKIS